MLIIRLIKIELVKEFKKKALIYMLCLVIIISGLTTYFYNKKDILELPLHEEIIFENKLNKKEFNKTGLKTSYESYLKKYDMYASKNNKSLKVNVYAKQKNIDLYQKEKIIFEKSFVIVLFLGLIISVIGGSIVSYEFNQGTIKSIVTKPIKRFKILLSKYIALNIISFIFILTLLISMIIFLKIICNTNIFTLQHIIYNNNTEIINYFIYFLKYYFINSAPIFFICSFSFFLSTITLSSVLSVGISIFILLMAPLISQILLNLNFSIIEFTFLPYLDFSIFQDYVYIINTNIFYNVNLNIGKGILILAMTSLLLYFIANLYFIKKDI